MRMHGRIPGCYGPLQGPGRRILRAHITGQHGPFLGIFLANAGALQAWVGRETPSRAARFDVGSCARVAGIPGGVQWGLSG